MEKYNILVVDDNIDDYELCQRLLSQHDKGITFQLHHVTSGQAALNHINDKVPDCVLLDYSLPGMDGLRVLQEIRKQNGDLPIIMLTGQGNENLAVHLLKSGARDYIVKSDILNLDLGKVIHQAIETSRKQDTKHATICILNIDDNADDREFVIRTLKKNNQSDYRFLEVDTGCTVMA